MSSTVNEVLVSPDISEYEVPSELDCHCTLP